MLVFLKGLWTWGFSRWAGWMVYPALGIAALVAFRTWDMIDDRRAIAKHEVKKTEFVDRRNKTGRKARRAVRTPCDVERVLRDFSDSN